MLQTTSDAAYSDEIVNIPTGPTDGMLFPMVYYDDASFFSTLNFLNELVSPCSIEFSSLHCRCMHAGGS